MDKDTALRLFVSIYGLNDSVLHRFEIMHKEGLIQYDEDDEPDQLTTKQLVEVERTNMNSYYDKLAVFLNNPDYDKLCAVDPKQGANILNLFDKVGEVVTLMTRIIDRIEENVE